MTSRGGWPEHAAAVDRLRASYAAIPRGAPVRLAKRTSNLFRPRSGVDVPGLDVSGLRGVIEVDPAARTAEVQGMCTYEDLVDATLAARADPAGGPAAAHDHAGRRGHRARDRGHQLPQRAAARVGPGDGRLHRRGRGRHLPPGGRPVRHVPELLRVARLRHPAADPPRAGAGVRRAAARPLRRRRPARQDRRRGRRDPGVRRHPGRRARRRRVRAGGVLPDPGDLGGGRGLDRLDRRAAARPPRPATTRGSGSSTGRSGSASPTC